MNACSGAASYIVEITPEIGKKAYHETQRNDWTEQKAEAGKWYRVSIMSKDEKNRGNGIPSDTVEVQTGKNNGKRFFAKLIVSFQFVSARTMRK